MFAKSKILSALIMVIATASCSEDDTQTQSHQPETAIYLIRHAEKEATGTNPNLTAEGLERADKWAVILQNVAFDAFYSTNYNRTLQTIAPIATSNGKGLLLYNTTDFSLSDVVQDHLGKNVFIVGHSNTIPQLINDYLGSNVYADIPETEFGNLYKITVVDGVVSHTLTVHN